MLRSSSRRTFDRFTNLGLPTALPTWLSSQTETRLATFGLPSAATSVVTQVGRAPRSSSVRSRSSSAAERERISASGTDGAERAPFRFGGAIAPVAGMSLFTTPVSDIPTLVSRAKRRRGSGNSTSPLAAALADRPDGDRVLVAGVVTHRQRPMTARGTTFANLEDETGLVNILISRGCWQRFRSIARSPALLIRGQLQRADGAINVIADNLAPLHLPTGAFHTSRDFR
jgi:hypothetical protein